MNPAKGKSLPGAFGRGASWGRNVLQSRPGRPRIASIPTLQPHTIAVSEAPSFDVCLARLRAGDEEAAAQVFHRFAHRLIGLARSRLDRLLRQKVDPEDVLQSVFQSFFAKSTEGHFELRDWDSLWAILTVITLRKCGRHLKHFLAARRDVRREVPGTSPDDLAPTGRPSAATPRPAEAAVLSETLETTAPRPGGPPPRHRHAPPSGLHDRRDQRAAGTAPNAPSSACWDRVRQWLATSNRRRRPSDRGGPSAYLHADEYRPQDGLFSSSAMLVEGAVARFEAAWLDGRSPLIDDYLPPARTGAACRAAGELVHIDLDAV